MNHDILNHETATAYVRRTFDVTVNGCRTCNFAPTTCPAIDVDITDAGGNRGVASVWITPAGHLYGEW